MPWHHQHQDYPDRKTSVPVSLLRALHEDMPLMIARRQRMWLCNHAGHHIFVEDSTKMSMCGRRWSIAG